MTGREPESPMESTWHDVDAYFVDRLALSDHLLDAALADSTTAGLPAIAVTAAEGRFLQLLAHLRGARRILEIGTLGGYSTIWMARALPPDGELITLEIDPGNAEVARKNIERAGLSASVSVVVAPATESLARLAADKVRPFDLVFIDADKSNSDVYFAAALGLSRVGTVIVVDNVVRKGEVLNAATTDENILGIRRLMDLLAAESRVSATALQTVGGKGYDGFVLAVVTEPAP
jgi:predicted O-methyltransferase YrrM